MVCLAGMFVIQQWLATLPASSMPHALHLQGTLPTPWMDMASAGPTMQLTRFACAHCGLSGALPAWGGPAGTCYTSSGLQFLDVSHNSFSGLVPDGFDSFGGLQAFNCSSNQLTGYFLKMVSNRCTGGFPHLQELRMDNNAFSDTESGECVTSVTACCPCGGTTGAVRCKRYSRCHSLTLLCAHIFPAIDNLHAAVTFLVAAWSMLASIKLLDASHNMLTSVPSQLPATLQQLYLDHNSLQGAIPAVYGAFPNLTCWSFDNNPSLCGIAPANTPCFDFTSTRFGESAGHRAVAHTRTSDECVRHASSSASEPPPRHQLTCVLSCCCRRCRRCRERLHHKPAAGAKQPLPRDVTACDTGSMRPRQGVHSQQHCPGLVTA